MRSMSRPRFIVGVLVAVLLVLWILFSRTESWAGGLCMRGLTSVPSQDSHPYLTFTKFGFPSDLVTITTTGCFENRTTTIDWHIGGLIVDVFLFVGVSMAPYWFPSLLRRLQRQPSNRSPD